jgi:hypothetical protein
MKEVKLQPAPGEKQTVSQEPLPDLSRSTEIADRTQINSLKAGWGDRHEQLIWTRNLSITWGHIKNAKTKGSCQNK